MTEETQIKRDIRQYLQVKRIFFWHNLQGLGCFRGLPDFMALKDGKIYGIEVKGKKGMLSKYQEEFLKEFLDYGGIVIVARSWMDVSKYL